MSKRTRRKLQKTPSKIKPIARTGALILAATAAAMLIDTNRIDAPKKGRTPSGFIGMEGKGEFGAKAPLAEEINIEYPGVDAGVKDAGKEDCGVKDAGLDSGKEDTWVKAGIAGKTPGKEVPAILENPWNFEQEDAGLELRSKKEPVEREIPAKPKKKRKGKKPKTRKLGKKHGKRQNPMASQKPSAERENTRPKGCTPGMLECAPY